MKVVEMIFRTPYVVQCHIRVVIAGVVVAKAICL